MVKKINKKNQAYGADQITVLEEIEAVRKRPGMYIGSTSEAGLFHCLREVVDNGIDEVMAGRANIVKISLLPDGFVRVEDNGAGIPVEKHKQTKKSTLETVMTMLHAGGKFGGGGYKVSGGLHGVGVSVVNALSIFLKAKVYRDGKIWEQQYSQGKPKTKVKSIGKTKKQGTVITFKPDASIFSANEFSWKKIIKFYRQQAYLTKGVKIIINDLRKLSEKETIKITNYFDKNPIDNLSIVNTDLLVNNYQFYFEGGVASYVKYLNSKKNPVQEKIFYIEKEIDEIKVEIGLQYNSEYGESVFTFTNNIYNPEGGTHLVGFKTGLTRTLNNYARQKNYLKEKDENLSGEDTRDGLTAVISVKLKNPQFEGQTKGKLGNQEVKSIVEQILSDNLSIFLEENPKEAEIILNKVMLASRARLAARTARASILRKGVLDGMTLPGKLADCSSKSSEKSEIYIVEGDSAGGSAKQGRDRDFQAILPLRGKVLNVERARLDKMLANNEIKSLIIALGTNVGEQLDISKLRYNKIIIMTDADVDGSHIRTLLLTLFYRYFKELIENGHIYIAQPPLYSIKKGKEIFWAYTDEDKIKILKKLKVNIDNNDNIEKNSNESLYNKNTELKSNGQKIYIQRYKGLGEMNPEQLWQTTMDPEKRFLKQIKIDDATMADQTFDILMGNEVGPRKKFIQTQAKKVKNLDI